MIKSDHELLLEASFTIDRMKREAQLRAQAIAELSKELTLLRAQLQAAGSQLAWAKRAIGRQDDNERYRTNMKNAGRGHLVGS